MRSFILPVVLGLASTMAFAAPPAKPANANAKGVDRATAVRSEEGNEHASGPRLVTQERGQVRRTSVKAHRTHSARRATSKEKTEKE